MIDGLTVKTKGHEEVVAEIFKETNPEEVGFIELVRGNGYIAGGSALEDGEFISKGIRTFDIRFDEPTTFLGIQFAAGKVIKYFSEVINLPNGEEVEGILIPNEDFDNLSEAQKISATKGSKHTFVPGLTLIEGEKVFTIADRSGTPIEGVNEILIDSKKQPYVDEFKQNKEHFERNPLIPAGLRKSTALTGSVDQIISRSYEIEREKLPGVSTTQIRFTTPDNKGNVGYVDMDGKRINLTVKQFKSVEQIIVEDNKISKESLDWIIENIK